MSVREEDQRKNNCPSRGLGLAAAAIGVGVGAALYYFFSKRPENPDTEGSTSQDWTCEQPQTFDITSPSSAISEYTTISEHTTTDTSINTTNDSVISVSSTDSQQPEDSTSDSEEAESESESYSEESESSGDWSEFLTSFDESLTSEWFNESRSSQDLNEWDVTDSSVDVPDLIVPNIISRIRYFIDSPRLNHPKVSRERKWSLEECSICFEVMLQDQHLMTLPCTHNFHVACIGPWLQEQQTCPMCRKAAE